MIILYKNQTFDAPSWAKYVVAQTNGDVMVFNTEPKFIKAASQRESRWYTAIGLQLKIGDTKPVQVVEKPESVVHLKDANPKLWAYMIAQQLEYSDHFVKRHPDEDDWNAALAILALACT